MKILMLCLSLALASNSYAQTDFANLFNQLNKINSKPTEPDALCDTCATGGSEVGPASVVKKIFDGKLTFLGRDLFPGSDQNRTCVYKSETAYILYHNCMASKKEAAATDIDIIDFNGGITHFYIENNHEGAISEMKRSEYSSTWTVDYMRSPAPGTLNLAGLKTYMEQNSTMNNKGGACFIGGTFKAQDRSTRSQCFGQIQDTPVANEWRMAAESFWHEPGERWYEVLKHLRKTVVGTKF